MGLLWEPTRPPEQLWREPSFSGYSWVINSENNEISSNCRYIVGLPKKDFLQVFVKDIYAMLFQFTMICVFLLLEKHSFTCFSLFKKQTNKQNHPTLSGVYYSYWPADGMPSVSQGCHHLTLFPRNAGLLPAYVQEQSHFPRTLLHPLSVFCLIAERNQNTENI